MILRVFRIVPLVALAMSVAGCGDSETAPSDYAPFSQTDLRVGTGADAVNGTVLQVHYTGWLYDGTKADNKGLQFDSSAGQDPLRFTLGVGQVIPGWDQGLGGMKAGGIRRLVIPPSLAYGGVRNGPIPQNSTLVFDVELVAVE